LESYVSLLSEDPVHQVWSYAAEGIMVVIMTIANADQHYDN
jgi:hypothetical protein